MKKYIEIKRKKLDMVSKLGLWLVLFIWGSVSGFMSVYVKWIWWIVLAMPVLCLALRIYADVMSWHIRKIEKLIKDSPYTLWENEGPTDVDPSPVMTAEEAARHLENLDMFYYQPDDMTPKQRKSIKFAIDFLHGPVVKDEPFIGLGGVY